MLLDFAKALCYNDLGLLKRGETVFFCKILSNISMFCENCGNKLPDGATVCDACNTPVEAEEVSAKTEVLGTDNKAAFEEAIAEAEVIDNTVNVEAAAITAETAVLTETTDQVAADGGFAAPDFEEKPPKKSKKGLKITLISVGSVIAALGITTLILFLTGAWFFVQGWFIRIFGSNQAYFRFVEQNNLTQITENETKSYNELFKLLSGEIGYEGNAEIKLSEQALSLMKDATDMDMSWLKNLSLDYAFGIEESKPNLNFAMNLGENSVLDLDFIADLKEEKAYVSLPVLTDKYLATKENDIDKEGLKAAQFVLSKELREALPKEDELNDIIEKYIIIALQGVEDVKSDSESVEIEGVEQDLLVLKYTFTEEDIAEILIDVLEEAQKDKEIEAYVEKVEEVAKDYLGKEVKDVDFYEEFIDAIDDAIDELEDLDDDDVEIILKDYVNNYHQIVGRSFEVDGDTIEYVFVQDGEKIASELSMIDELEMVGKGTIDGDKAEMNFNLSVKEQEIAEFEITVDDMKAAADGKLCGKIKIVPNMKSFAKMTGMSEKEAFALSAIKVALECEYKQENDNSNVIIKALYGDETFAEIALTSNKIEEPKVSVPSDGKTTTDEDKWAGSLKLDKIVKALEKANAPKEIINILKYSSVEDLLGLGSPSYEDDLYKNEYTEEIYDEDYEDYYDYDSVIEEDYYDDFF